MKKGSKLRSIIGNKCPRCQEGPLWKTNNPYSNFFTKNSMHEKCDCCDLTYTKELGFWYGAMFVSYALSVIIFVISALSLYFGSAGTADKMTYVWVILTTGVLLAPVNHYLSRLIWINLFVKYDKNVDCIKASS